MIDRKAVRDRVLEIEEPILRLNDGLGVLQMIASNVCEGGTVDSGTLSWLADKLKADSDAIYAAFDAAHKALGGRDDPAARQPGVAI